MRWSENDRKIVWEARRLRKDLRWGRGQLWVCVIVGCAVVGLGAHSSHEHTTGLLIATAAYFVYRSIRMLMWWGQLGAKLRLLREAGLFPSRGTVPIRRNARGSG